MPSEEQHATEDKEAAQFSDAASEAKESNPFMDWHELETKGNRINFDQIPAFNVRFAELIRKTTRCSAVFTDLLRTGALIFSYEKFVNRLGGTPASIFNIFRMRLIKIRHVNFLNLWMLAQYPRLHPVINTTEQGVDL